MERQPDSNLMDCLGQVYDKKLHNLLLGLVVRAAIMYTARAVATHHGYQQYLDGQKIDGQQFPALHQPIIPALS